MVVLMSNLHVNIFHNYSISFKSSFFTQKQMKHFYRKFYFASCLFIHIKFFKTMKNLLRKNRFSPSSGIGGLLLGLILAYSLNSCNWFKDPEPTELPPITQEGKNTFGCKVNGKVWIPNGFSNGFGNPTPPISGYFRKRCDDRGNCTTYKTWTLKLLAEKATGENPGSLYVSAYSMYLDGTADDLGVTFKYNGVSYEVDINQSNAFNVTRLDTATAVIAGTFYFIGTDSKGNKITVTDGRFDVKYTK
jgi:hypothetical protein